MSKRKAGFIQNLSPKKPGRFGCSHYNFQIQSSEDTAESVIGFGDREYEKLSEFETSRHPVKISLRENPKYDSLLFNESGQLQKATAFDVNFPFVQLNSEMGTGNASSSKSTEVAALQKASNTDSTYYSVRGTLFLGAADPKQLPSATKGERRVVKEDCIIKDQSGEIAIHIWEPLLTKMKDRVTYAFTHLKVKRFRGEVYMTTSPLTGSTVIDQEIADDADIPTLATSVSLSIGRFEDISMNHFFTCKCNRRIDKSDGSKCVKCNHCNTFLRSSELQCQLVVDLTFKKGDDEVTVKAYTDVVSKIMSVAGGNVNDDESSIAETLFDMENITLTYNLQTMVLQDVQMKEAVDKGSTQYEKQNKQDEN